MNKVTLDSPATYCNLYGLKASPHPLVAVVDLRKASKVVNHITMKYEVYALFLKNGSQCSLKYGRNIYDCQEGTIVSFAPGQVVVLDDEVDELSPEVTGLIFHPDLLYGTSLDQKIKNFDFFNYSQQEALHLSEPERNKFNFYMGLIAEELARPVDSHSASVLSAHINLLLEHLDRFYDRQFITRHKVNSDVVAQFHINLKNYFNGNDAATIPNVSYFADKAALSTGYFSSLIKKETGMTPREVIAVHLIDEAKRRLIETDNDISEIAYSLGFEYPAHFTRLFKKVTAETPTQYRFRRM